MPLRRVSGRPLLRCTPRDPILSKQFFFSHPRDPILSTQTFSFTPRNPILSTLTFFSHPSRPDFIYTKVSRNCCTSDSYYTMLFYATPLHRYSLLAMLLATPNASRYSQCCYSLLATHKATRDASRSQRLSVLATLATRNIPRYSQRYSQRYSLLATLLATA